MQATNVLTERQFGLDWLRIGAFGLLILYHIGMFFVQWGWHIKTVEPVAWLEWPMAAINPWRLSLLFVISGIVSRTMLSKLAKPGKFASTRSWRLLVPLLAGVVLFVPPQPWVELTDQGRISSGFAAFWLDAYFEFGDRMGLVLPTWNHLWFVVYLWVYSMMLAAAALLPAALRAWLQQLFDGLFARWRLAVLPILWLLAARYALHPLYGETHALVDDPYAHAVYGFAFFFGVGLARSVAAWDSIARHWRTLLALMLGSIAVSLALRGMAADDAMLLAKAGARSVLAWSAILGLLGFARAHLHHDGPVRRYLTDAIFPYYIVHQTIIVLVGFALKYQGWGATAEFLIIFAATIIGCALTYEIARRIAWLRPIMGLKVP